MKFSNLPGAIAFVLFNACLPFTSPAAHDAVQVDVELVLAVDISNTMDPVEQRLQRNGYIQALRSQEFIGALKGGPHGRIALAYMHWADKADQEIVAGWTLIDSMESARAFAARLEASPYRRASRTSISGAIDVARRLFTQSPFRGARRVIDISGDGPNNDGGAVAQARDDAIAEGIVINGLPLMFALEDPSIADISDLDSYFEDCVIGGAGAFVVPVYKREDIARATLRKLVTEIAALPSPLVRLASQPEPRVSCLVGERLFVDGGK